MPALYTRGGAARFQSTLPAEARGDSMAQELSALYNWFQSTLPAEARGDSPRAAGHHEIIHVVSIHSPRRSEGRPTLQIEKVLPPKWFQSTLPAEARGDLNDASVGVQVEVMFQSTLPAEARGDAYSYARLGSRSCFNPLSPPKRGETRPKTSVLCLRLSRFNPLSPPKRGETIASLRNAPALAKFQSTLPAEARGDSSTGTIRNIRRCFNPLSPPKRGETGNRHQAPVWTFCFNPLSPPKRGETRVEAGRRERLVVSIHSPRRSEGRLPGTVLLTVA